MPILEGAVRQRAPYMQHRNRASRTNPRARRWLSFQFCAARYVTQETDAKGEPKWVVAIAPSEDAEPSEVAESGERSPLVFR